MSEATPRAAVAMLLRIEEGEFEVLLLKRAEREGDRWSGQISLPGGREEPGDESLAETAVRETEEETALDLSRDAEPLGSLPAIQARAKGKAVHMTITPFIFRQRRPSPIQLNEEAVASFWFPLGRAAAGEFDGTFEKRYDGEQHELPCWDFEGYRIWGLTFEMLRRLLPVLEV
jgi:8-oxo-dGTP pyrophosphatase MutT (NUDIX family)